MSATGTPQPGDFQEPLKQVLSLLVNSKASGTASMTASAISSLLLKNHGIHLHWKTIDHMLRKNPELVARKKEDKKWKFTVLQAGQEEVSKGDSPIFFVNPAKAVHAVFTLHQFFATLKGTIRLCDPYLDLVTLQHLETFTAAKAVRILTHNISDSPTLRLALTALASQKQVEVRKTSSNILHDRYVIDDNWMLILGTSLNSFGKKQSFVIKTGQDIREALLDNFNALWGAAAVWP